MKISIIIPVYNTEKYLPECLDSIFCQNFDGFEVIAVNDGSTDSSPQILRKYAEKYPNLKIIDKENEGQGYAKKVGIDVAGGDYIMFADNDDLLEPEAFEKLYSNITKNNSDIAIMRIIFWDHVNNKTSEPENINLTGNFKDTADFEKFTFTHRDVKSFVLNGCVTTWSKIYKRSFLEKYNDLNFPKHTCYEDGPFHLQVMLRAEKISFCPYQLYRYRMSNTKSTMHTSMNSKKSFEIFSVIRQMKDILQSEGFFEEYKSEHMNYSQRVMLYLYNTVNNTLKADFYKEMKTTLEQLNISINDISENVAIYKMIFDCETHKEFVLTQQVNATKSELEQLKSENEQLNLILKNYQSALQQNKDSFDEIKKSWSFRIGNGIVNTIMMPIKILKRIAHKK